MHEQFFNLPQPDYTPEQKAAICAERKKLFTVEDLIGYIEDDEPVIPMEEVWEKLLAKVEVWKRRKAGTD